MIESIDHINLVVRDLPKMVRFYTEVLDLRVTKRAHISGFWVEQVVALDQVQAEVVYLEADQGCRLELIYYVNPDRPRPVDLDRANTPGLRHLAFRIKNIEAATDRLHQAGGKLISKIQQVPDSQVRYTGGVHKRLVYFLDPEQNLLELCEYH